jgi:hypothetical protein
MGPRTSGGQVGTAQVYEFNGDAIALYERLGLETIKRTTGRPLSVVETRDSTPEG